MPEVESSQIGSRFYFECAVVAVTIPVACLQLAVKGCARRGSEKSEKDKKTNKLKNQSILLIAKEQNTIGVNRNQVRPRANDDGVFLHRLFPGLLLNAS